MANANNKIKEVSSKVVRIQKELDSLVGDYSGLHDFLRNKLREEAAYNGSYEGLETFNALNNTVSKNLSSIKNALYLMKRLKNLSAFSISEIEEEVINGDISKLLK